MKIGPHNRVECYLGCGIPDAQIVENACGHFLEIADRTRLLRLENDDSDSFLSYFQMNTALTIPLAQRLRF